MALTSRYGSALAMHMRVRSGDDTNISGKWPTRKKRRKKQQALTRGR